MICLNKIKKFIGSIYTSFLYIIICVLIILEFAISFIRINNINFASYLNGERLYSYVGKNSIISKDILVDYLNEYSYYIFYKRSYPTINYSVLNDSEKKEFNRIKKRIDIPFEKVLIIRDINMYIHNNSIYLLLNISLLVFFLLLSKRYKSFIKGLYFMSLMVLLCSLVILLFSTYFITNVNNYYIKEIFRSENFMSKLYRINTLYICVSFILSTLTFFYNMKLTHK